MRPGSGSRGRSDRLLACSIRRNVRVFAPAVPGVRGRPGLREPGSGNAAERAWVGGFWLMRRTGRVRHGAWGACAQRRAVTRAMSRAWAKCAENDSLILLLSSSTRQPSLTNVERMVAKVAPRQRDLLGAAAAASAAASRHPCAETGGTGSPASASTRSCRSACRASGP
jgi:hypothetical protein